MKLDRYATGERMRKARVAAGYKQYKAAPLIGVTPGVLSRWECGIRMPFLEHFVIMADLYRVPMEKLVVITEEGDKDGN